MPGDCPAAEDLIGPSEHGSVVCPVKLPLVIHQRLVPAIRRREAKLFQVDKFFGMRRGK